MLYTRLFPVALLICGAALALLLALTHSAPLPDFGSGLALCEVPCWAGIEPGRTRFEDTAAMVTARLPESDLHLLNDRLDFHAPSANLVGALSSRQGQTVDAIQINVSQPLWATLLTLGAPQCIQYIDRQLSDALNIFWAIDGVYVRSNVNLSWANPEVTTSYLQLWVSPPESPCITSDNVAPWPGFFALG